MAGSLFMISRFPYSISFPPSLVHEDLLLKCSRSSIHVWAKKKRFDTYFAPKGERLFVCD